jgi:hypothetical protein
VFDLAKPKRMQSSKSGRAKSGKQSERQKTIEKKYRQRNALFLNKHDHFDQLKNLVQSPVLSTKNITRMA